MYEQGREVEQLVNSVLASSKYSQIAPELVRSIGASEILKRRNLKEAIKATKNKLHQIGGAYQAERMAYTDWLQTLRRAEDGAALRSACSEIMAHHASTRERLPILAEFYSTLLADLAPMRSVLDLACGLNPLAIPWMPLAADARYFACDIYADQVKFLHAALPLLGVGGEAAVCDLLQGCPTQVADVALLLKTIPCLEQVDKTIGRRLLAEIQAPVLIVSFPAHSLGGRSKGMAATYERHFAELVAGQSWQIERFAFAGELIFRLRH